MDINELFNLLFSETNNLGEKLKIKNAEIPKKLYKYKSINENTLNLLKTDVLYLANVKKLNDPYEGEIFFDEDKLYNYFFMKKILPSAFKKFNLDKNLENKIKNSLNPQKEYYKFIYDNDPIVNKDNSFEYFFEKQTELNKNYMNKPIIEFNDARKNDIYLTCFSKTNLINPMWAHYADEHKGICIEYNIHDCEEQFIKNSCYPIRYDDDYDYTNELLDIKSNKFKILMEPLLKKSTEWAYEEEWRLLFDYNTTLQGVIHVGSKYFVKLPKPRAIYLGCNILEENMNKILSICNDREIMVHQMALNKKNHQLNDEKILLKYSRYCWEEPEFIKECIVNRTYKNLIKYYFYPNNRSPDLNNVIGVLTYLDENDIISFLNELLFKNEIFPVLHYYFYNVLLFLNKLNNNANFKNFKTKDDLNIENNIRIWLRNCLSNFYENKIIRYMIFYEKLFMRFYNRYVILDDDEKEFFESKLINYSIKSDYVSLIYDKYNMNLIHPYCNKQMFELINDSILENLQIMINTFYKNGTFNEILCYDEYLNLYLIVDELEKYSQKKYDIIYENSSLPSNHEWIFNETYDNSLSLTCQALKNNSELLKLLSSKDKNLIKNIGTIFFNHDRDIVNLVFKCCKLLNLNYKIEINDKNLISNYFNPIYNPYNLIH